MSEFLNTLNPVALFFGLIAATASFVGMAIFAYNYSIKTFNDGVVFGRSINHQDVFNAEFRGYWEGFEKGKNAGILSGL